MFKYRVFTILLGILFLLPGVANALSLGNIQVKSSFAQPFFAEIEIPSYTSDELESLEVKLASKASFDSLGLELQSSVEKFIFEVAEKPNGVPFIKVYTRTPVKELSISFVVEARWLGGKILKDYHILLTPEAITELREEQFMKQQLAEVDAGITNEEPQIAETPKEIQEPVTTLAQAPEVSAIEEEPEPKVEPKQSQRQERSSKLKKFGANGLQYTSVGRGDTLSQIAQQMQGDDVSLNQVMMALYEQNLNAFVNRDIHKLKAGVKLKVNDVNDFKQRTRREAMLLAQQYLFPGQSPDLAETVMADGDEVVKPEPEESQGNRLEIASVSEEEVPPEVMAKLKQEQIASSEEELKYAKQAAADIQAQNEEMKNRIAQLEAQMAEMSRHLMMLNAQVPSAAPDANSATQQTDNLIVSNTDAALAKADNLSIIERIQMYQTALSIGGISLLSLALVMVRKKDQLKAALSKIRNKSNVEFIE